MMRNPMPEAMVPRLVADALPATHGFFSREGGVSAPPYDSLNGGRNTQDDPHALEENERRVTEMMGVEPAHLLGVDQVHGVEVMSLTQGGSLWPVAQRPKADALVSDRPDVALTITTADCAPVLLSSGDGAIVGAAHAGWRGAVAGVLEATIEHMRALGARDIVAVVGPCIGPAQYEVGVEMQRVVLARHPTASSFFRASEKADHAFFDLPGFCVWRLKESKTARVESLGVDTLRDVRYFSHRRTTLAGSTITGRQMSAIRPFF